MEFPFGIGLFVIGFEGEADQDPTRFVRSQLGCDVVRAFEADRQLAVPFLEFGRGDLFGGIVRDGGAPSQEGALSTV